LAADPESRQTRADIFRFGTKALPERIKLSDHEKLSQKHDSRAVRMARLT